MQAYEVRLTPLSEISCEGVAPQGLAGKPFGQSEFVKSIAILPDIHESGINLKAAQQFQILLQSQQTISVRGHSVEYISNGQSETGSYAIVSKAGGSDHYVAMFPASQVIGIFAGQIVSAS